MTEDVGVCQAHASRTDALHTLCTARSGWRLERSNLVVQVNSLCGPNSEWLKLYADLQHLPRFLAKYTCARFHASHPQLVPDPMILLSHQENTQIVNMVQVVAPRNNHRSAGKQRPGSIAPFNVLAIRYPAVAG